MNLQTIRSRTIEEVINARATTDGDGVKLLRVFGGRDLSRFDPFLMLDEFGSDQKEDYQGGFPPHPHRGFETVTYMLEGKMEHRDHMDNVGLLESGGVQWMKAGSGVIHSEMPKQEEGLMHGFQLWINLPAEEKMTPATYEDIKKNKIPEYILDNVVIKAVSGNFLVNDLAVNGVLSERSTKPGYLDIHIENSAELNIVIPKAHNTLLYVYSGEVMVGDSDYRLSSQQLARLSKDGPISIKAEESARLLLLSGLPINQAIVQHGPFVMNTVEEIERAINDYNNGTLVSS